MPKRILLTLLLAIGFQAAAYAQLDQSAVIRYTDLQHPVLGWSGMVAAQNRSSAAVGAKILADGGNAVDAADAPRMHHQWYPDELVLEPGFSPDTIRLLQQRGHTVLKAQSSSGSTQSVEYRDGVFRGASDTRRPGAGSVAPDEFIAHEE